MKLTGKALHLDVAHLSNVSFGKGLRYSDVANDEAIIYTICGLELPFKAYVHDEFITCFTCMNLERYRA